MGEEKRIDTGGGMALDGNANTAGGDFAGRDSATTTKGQINEITVRANDNDYRVTALETKLSILEAITAQRFTDYENRLNATNRTIDRNADELREEFLTEVSKRPVPPITWHFWVSGVLTVIAIMTMFYFIHRLDSVVSLLNK